MKKCYFIILFIFLSVSVSSSQTIDYTQGLSIWFDTPNGLDNRAIWLRASGLGNNPDKAWENSSLPIGNGSLGANILGSIRRTEYRQRSRILLERKQTVGKYIKGYPTSLFRWKQRKGGPPYSGKFQRPGRI